MLYRTEMGCLCEDIPAGMLPPGGKIAGGRQQTARMHYGVSGRSACSAAIAVPFMLRLLTLRVLPARAGRLRPTPGCRQAP